MATKTILKKNLEKSRKLQGNLAGFYYVYRKDYPKDQWKEYYNRYKSLGGRLSILQLGNKIINENY